MVVDDALPLSKQYYLASLQEIPTIIPSFTFVMNTRKIPFRAGTAKAPSGPFGAVPRCRRRGRGPAHEINSSRGSTGARNASVWGM